MRSLARQASRHGTGKVKPAVMTVSMLSSSEGDEEAAGTTGDAERTDSCGAGDGAALVVELWRADLLSAIVELGPGCTILRADHAAGLMFGLHPASMTQHHLYK